MLRGLGSMGVLALALGASSCPSGIGGGGGGATAAADVTGTWDGTWDSHGGHFGGASMVLTQVGTSADGNGALDGSICVFGQVVSGQVNGDRFSGSYTSATTAVTFTLTLSGAGDNHLDGTFLVTLGGVCTGDSGTISMTRQ